MSLFTPQRRSSPFPEPFLPAYPGQNPFGMGVKATSEGAMRVSAVWACVRLLSDSIAMMPLEQFGVRDGQRIPTKPGQLLMKPSADDTTSEWVQKIVVSLLLRGNAYGQIVDRDGNGYPTQIELISPDVVGIHTEPKTGRLEYTFNGVHVDRDDIFHVPGLALPGMKLGLSPIEYAARTIGTATAAQAFGQGFFTDGAQPSAILSSDQAITPDQAAQMKARFKDIVNGRDTAVLGNGLKWQPIQVSPEESQFLATQKHSVTQIASIFGVPPEMVGGDSGSSMTYSNVTQRSLDFLTYAVQPWLTRIENAIFPLIPGVRHVRFNTNVLVRMTPTDRWNVHQVRLQNGAVTINEVRSDEGMQPVDWGNEPYLPAIKTQSAKQALLDEAAEGEDPPEPNEPAAPIAKPKTKGATP